MNNCYACGQLIESRWQVCPYCSTPLNTQQNIQPIYVQQIPAQAQQMQPQYQSGYMPQVSEITQYQNYPQQMIIAPTGGTGKSIGVVLLIAIFAVALTVVLAGVLYVWASSIADGPSDYTWRGDLSSQTQDARWYDSEGRWEKYSSSNTLDSSEMRELSQNFSSIEVQFDGMQFRMIYEAESTSEFEDLTLDGRQQIVTNVWFFLMTELTVDGEVTNVDDGECLAQVHEDAYINSNSWRNEVSSTNWPSWCESVRDY